MSMFRSWFRSSQQPKQSSLGVEAVEALILLSGSCHSFSPVPTPEPAPEPPVDNDDVHACEATCDALPTCGIDQLHETCIPQDDVPSDLDECPTVEDCSADFCGYDEDCVIHVDVPCVGDADANCDGDSNPDSCSTVPANECNIPPEPTMPCVDDFDSILAWNDVMLQANANDHSLDKPEQGGPILTSRAFAIVSAAMYDAYNSIEHIGKSYLTQVYDTEGANSDAAVSQAAYDTLVELFPSQKSFFDAELHNSLNKIEDGSAEDYGRMIGNQVASAILQQRELDGYQSFSSTGYVPVDAPGFHNVDPLNPQQGFYGANAGNIDPFVVQDSSQFAGERIDDGTIEGRAAFLQSKKYTEAYKEIKEFGGDGVNSPTSRTAEQTEIGIYWAYDGRPGLGTPPRLYNQIVREVAIEQGNSEAENAQLFALVNISMADAGTTTWNGKYADAFWRPILGVRGGELDGNAETVGDANWRPLGAPASNPRPGEIDFTPPFPAYVSGHAAFGAATFQTLTRFYGRDDIHFSFQSDELNGQTIGSDGVVRPAVTRSFESFTEAKEENAQSRIYLGIHWSFDAKDGIETGDHVANYVYDTLIT